MNYYEILGVPRDATEHAIRAAYKRLALKYHPDKNRNLPPEEAEKATAAFQLITEAHTVLTNLKEKARYDADPENYKYLSPQERLLEDFWNALKTGDIATLDATFAAVREAGHQPEIDPSFVYNAYTMHNFERMEWLVQHDALVNKPILGTNGNSYSCLQLIIFEQDAGLRKKGLEILLKSPNLDINQKFVFPTTYTTKSTERRGNVTITTTYRHPYDWNTNALAWALHTKNIALAKLFVTKGANFDGITFPKDKPALVYLAENDWHEFLDLIISARTPIDADLIADAISKCGFLSHSYSKLRAYRQQHYRYNPFKFLFNFGYGQQWLPEVDNSWFAIRKQLPNKFKEAVTDAISSIKSFCDYISRWEFIVPAIYYSALTAIAIGLFVWQINLLSSLVSAQLFEDILGLTLIAPSFAVIFGTAFYDKYAPSVLTWLHTNIDPTLIKIRDFIYKAPLKLFNHIAGLFTARHDQAKAATAATKPVMPIQQTGKNKNPENSNVEAPAKPMTNLYRSKSAPNLSSLSDAEPASNQAKPRARSFSFSNS